MQCSALLVVTGQRVSPATDVSGLERERLDSKCCALNEAQLQNGTGASASWLLGKAIACRVATTRMKGGFRIERELKGPPGRRANLSRRRRRTELHSCRPQARHLAFRRKPGGQSL